MNETPDVQTLIRRIRLESIALKVDGQQLRATGPRDALGRWQPTLSRHGWAIRRYIEALQFADDDE